MKRILCILMLCCTLPVFAQEFEIPATDSDNPSQQTTDVVEEQSENEYPANPTFLLGTAAILVIALAAGAAVLFLLRRKKHEYSSSPAVSAVPVQVEDDEVEATVISTAEPVHEDGLLQGGKYKIVRHISSGGFGNTYEGYDVNLDKKIAIKEFFVKDYCTRGTDTMQVTVTTPAKHALIQHLKQKFIEEARSIAKMEHENIVKVQALFEENGTAYYVMDYIEGESVQSLLKRRGSLPEQEALPIIFKVAGALGYMHRQNRYHLDVKPGNIMLRNDGKVILIDFGSSKQYAEVDGESTTTLAPCYTPGYAPSEQMNPKRTNFTAATDVYALGATLYKMLSGVTPPSAIDLQNEDETLAPLPAEISQNVKECIEKSMIPQRSKRLQSIGEFVAMLTGASA